MCGRGLDKRRLDRCVAGSQGTTLLAASAQRARAARASASPTIIFDGAPYRGGRAGSDFVRATCRALAEKKAKSMPATCASIPAPVVVSVTVLSDKRCKRCRASPLARNLRGRFFPQLKLHVADYGTVEGKALYARYKLKLQPVWLFDADVVRASGYHLMARWMIKLADGRRRLRAAASWDPRAEICDNGVDDTGNGKVDCKDPSCTRKLVCRPKKKRHLALFMMSLCPFAARGLKAMQSVLPRFGRRLRFEIHYIAEHAPQDGSCRCRSLKPHRGFCALHGVQEVVENMRRLCAKHSSGKRDEYLRYIFCRTKDYRSSDWQRCATGGIRASVLARCVRGKLGPKLLSRDLAAAQALSIKGSPTWLLNNTEKFSGINASTIKQHFCKANPRTVGCR